MTVTSTNVDRADETDPVDYDGSTELSETLSHSSIDSDVPIGATLTRKATATSPAAHARGGNLRRRSSAAMAPSFEPGAFSAINRTPTTPHYRDQPSVIPPPVPESLPTTPGYELNGTSYFDQPAAVAGLSLPHQQTVLQGGGVDNKLEDVTRGMTLTNPPKSRWRLFAVIVFSISAGFSDGAPGALLPRIEEYYNINYTIVSLIWMANAMGFITVALFSHKLQPWLGPRKMLAFGCFCLIIMYALVSSAAAFPAVVVGFFFGGLGLATNQSFQNIFLSRFDKASRYLGYYHGAYGLGACIGPLVATALVNSGVKWSYFYYILLGLSCFNLIDQFFAFEGYEEDARAWERYEPLLEEGVTPDGLSDSSLRLVPTESIDLDETSSKMMGSPSMKSRVAPRDSSVTPLDMNGGQENTYESVNPSDEKGKENEELKEALRSPRTWYLSFFVLFYQGAEVSMGGWVVTFLETYRHGDTRTTGYVASGFWGGLTLGRLLLTPNISRTIGAKRGVSILVITSVILGLLAWLVPKLEVEAVMVGLIGLFTGPMYPLMVTTAVKVLPRKIQVISMTIMTAFGSSGGAIFPFLVGLLSGAVGTYVVMPVFVCLLSLTLVLWYNLPNPDRAVVRYKWQRLF